MTKPVELSVLNRLKGIASAGPTEDEKSLVWDNDTNSLKFIAPGNATTIQNIPVDVNGVQDGHVLTYDVASGKFIPKPKPMGGGGLYEASALIYKPALLNPATEYSGFNAVSDGRYFYDMISSGGANDTPTFTFSASSESTASYPAWEAFSSNLVDEWHSATNTRTGSWLQVQSKFGAFTVKEFMLSFSGNYSPSAFQIVGSLDGVAWTTLIDISGLTIADWANPRYYQNPSASTAYSYYKLIIVSHAHATNTYYICVYFRFSQI